MKFFILLGHPNKSSFNHAIANACKDLIEKEGHIAFFHDLYAEKFNPIRYNDDQEELDDEIILHTEHLKSSDAIIVIHPNWWGQPPAIIKGWVDRVLRPGVAYDLKLEENGEYRPQGLLASKVALVLNTSNTPNSFEDDVLDTIWKKSIFNICGVSNVKRINFGLVKRSDESQRRIWLDDVRHHVNALIPSQDER